MVTCECAVPVPPAAGELLGALLDGEHSVHGRQAPLLSERQLAG